ncbi:hypothetical protein P4N68_06975 [Corynebacterium felinum]|uniref:Uncharacterized protein n=1 Tax=Corynebacterium felinum TaxID=131318 RepID=A0ABU2BBR9_9CORY|nr:hypothetical protein [Corynebacterium felinum]MDF5820825.1 hypothetical protein [Corynebacterium felinum]MDR7356065.1 hypothetical protein [Corynebacterium felinum]WJY95400.1 hypothetical protein CFELI_08975 [Corynebacterium felinum]
MQPDRAVSIKLNGELDEIEAKTVITALELLTKLVQDFLPSSTKVTMAKLEEGSAILGVHVDEEIEQRLTKGIYQILEDREIPSDWSLKQVKNVHDLAKLSQRSGVESVALVDHENRVLNVLDNSLINAVEKALKELPYSLGSVRGELYSYSASSPTFVAKLRSEARHGVVRIEFDEDLDPQVRSLLRKNVDVYGLIQRHPESNQISYVRVRRIEQAPDTPNYLSGRGIWRDCAPDGISAVELVRRMRDSSNHNGASEVPRAREC